jgi:hypothetical protein
MRRGKITSKGDWNMMKKAVFWLAIAVMVMAAGCASTGAVEDTGLAEEPAVQLAANINAIEAGKATVSGDTVTLTDWVRLKTALTVPEGVTLDLTADGAALELQETARS